MKPPRYLRKRHEERGRRLANELTGYIWWMLYGERPRTYFGPLPRVVYRAPGYNAKTRIS